MTRDYSILCLQCFHNFKNLLVVVLIFNWIRNLAVFWQCFLVTRTAVGTYCFSLRSFVRPLEISKSVHLNFLFSGSQGLLMQLKWYFPISKIRLTLPPFSTAPLLSKISVSPPPISTAIFLEVDNILCKIEILCHVSTYVCGVDHNY